MTTGATVGYGCLLKRGDGGVGASVKASISLGSSNSIVKLFWKTAGSVGNGKTGTVVVSGASTPLSVTVTTSAVVINSATNGSSVATSTANDAISALYANSTFNTYWDATGGSGNGTGTLAAVGLTALAGGTDGGEAFTTIAQVKGFSGPSLAGGVAETTSFDSASGFREYIATLRDAGTISFPINYLPQNATHKGLITDYTAGTLRDWQLCFNDTSSTVFAFSGIITTFDVAGPIDAPIGANVSFKLSGVPTWTP